MPAKLSRYGRVTICFFFTAVFSLRSGAQQATPIADSYRVTANRIIAAALADSAAWNRTAELVDRFGHRLSGSASLERAIDWILAGMRRDGLQNVRGEPVMVPRWVRGTESATLVSPRQTPLHMIGLGLSVGTSARGITAPCWS